jgi:hypothetical protein
VRLGGVVAGCHEAGLLTETALGDFVDGAGVAVDVGVRGQELVAVGLGAAPLARFLEDAVSLGNEELVPVRRLDKGLVVLLGLLAHRMVEVEGGVLPRDPRDDVLHRGRVCTRKHLHVLHQVPLVVRVGLRHMDVLIQVRLRSQG